MPFLKRGKARARQNRIVPPSPEPAVTVPEVSVAEEQKVPYQEVTYRVPKEQRLLDLPLEEEVFKEEEQLEEETVSPDENIYNIQPVGDPVSIGEVLKKKKKK